MNERNRATSVGLPGIPSPLSLEYIGEGSTCVVYRTPNGDIVKEFYPVIIEDTSVIMTMERPGENGRLVLISSLPEFEKKIVEERRDAFLHAEIELISDLQKRNVRSDDNMFLIPRIQDTTLGPCQWCNHLAGTSVSQVFNEAKAMSFQKRFIVVLPHIIRLFDEIAFYHSDLKGDGTFNDCLEDVILNLDIKAENLFAIKSRNDKYVAVRNLDFGSGKYATKLIADIQGFAGANKHLHSEELRKKIRKKYFASSKGYYDLSPKGYINSIIEDCIQNQGDIHKSKQVRDLKMLDIRAGLKTFLFALSDLPHNDFSGQERIGFINLFKEIFEDPKHEFINDSLFENYYIYSQLYEIMARCFGSDPENRLSATDIANRLRNILCLIDGDIKATRTEAQKKFVAMSKIYRSKNELLKNHELKTIKDILNFCESNILDICDIGSIHWFLLTGKHKNGK